MGWILDSVELLKTGLLFGTIPAMFWVDLQRSCREKIQHLTWFEEMSRVLAKTGVSPDTLLQKCVKVRIMLRARS